MWFIKKKKQVFGGSIQPSCRHCLYNSGEEKVLCQSKNESETVCKKYAYDPLKREPKREIKLRSFDKQDFEL